MSLPSVQAHLIESWVGVNALVASASAAPFDVGVSSRDLPVARWVYVMVITPLVLSIVTEETF